ncbi:hypothetical protein [Actinoplanes regularis]|uniref:hypothetical protein n=1 Tax=Actinoplanes regularis TaxID=52697 RepID=UPI0015C5E0A2|nr:hypothetical protein [Actinoplanes regularis]
MSVEQGESRGVSVRAVFAYGAALAMTQYLLIKISWVIGALFGLIPRDEHFSVAGFVLLNTVTIGMAAAAIALALALVRPWGERIPAFVVLSCAWIGCGFLVPMLPYALLDTLISATSDSSGSAAPVMPAWEYSLLQVSFLGMGAGLAVALPFYLKARWPAAFDGRIGAGGTAVRPTRVFRLGAGLIALVGASSVGVLNLYWAMGGTIGLDQPAARESSWYLQVGNTGIWSLAGAWSIWVVTRGRPAMPLWIPVSVSWLASGFLVAWGGWKLPLAVIQILEDDTGTVWPEQLGVAVAQFLLSVVAGAGMLSALLTFCRSRLSPADASRRVGAKAGPKKRTERR